MCSHYSPFILLAASRFQVNPKILDAMIFVESADGANTNHSSGEIGVMAVSRAAEADVKIEFKDTINYNLQDPHDNIFIAAGYLLLCFRVWNNWDRAIVAYNTGIKREIANWETYPYLVKVKERMRFKC
jgi:soluble lytic murein transglycosylase-like protein